MGCEKKQHTRLAERTQESCDSQACLGWRCYKPLYSEQEGVLALSTQGWHKLTLLPSEGICEPQSYLYWPADFYSTQGRASGNKLPIPEARSGGHQSRLSNIWGGQLLGRLTKELPHGPAVLFLGIPPKEWKVSVTQSCPTLCNPKDCSLPGSAVHGIFPARILEWVDIRLQGIFLTQELNLGLLNCRLILYHLSHQGSKENSKRKCLKC